MTTFRTNDRVRRRLGTLGATGAEGTVVEVQFGTSTGYHEMVTVKFDNGREECFISDTYELVSGMRRVTN